MSERGPSVFQRLIEFLKLCIEDKEKTINLVTIASVFTLIAISLSQVSGD